MQNLLSGALGGLIGTLISSLISYFIFRKQFQIDSNRHILESMYEKIRFIYTEIELSHEINEETLSFLLSYNAIGLPEFKKVKEELSTLRSKLNDYNKCHKESLKETSTAQVDYKNNAKLAIDNLVKKLRRLS